MKKMKIEANANPNKNNELKEPRHCEVTIDMPDTTEEALKLYGEEVCFTKIRQAVVIDAQGTARRKLEAGQTGEQVQGYFNNVNVSDPSAPAKPWKPGVTPLRKSSVDKLVDKASDMTDEEFNAFVLKIREKRKAPAGK